MRSVDVVGLHMEIESGSPVLVLREQEPPHRLLPLFIGGVEALAIAGALEGWSPARPLTHDLLATLVETLHAHVDHVEVTGVRDGAFLAELALTGPGGARRVDSRPSDAIALALRVDAPLFVDDAVLEESAAVVELTDVVDDVDDVEDERAIEEEVVRFRSFLAELDPSAFDTGPDDDPPAT